MKISENNKNSNEMYFVQFENYFWSFTFCPRADVKKRPCTSHTEEEG